MAIVLENTGSFGDHFAGASGQMSGSIGFTPTIGRKLLMAISHAQVNIAITKIAQTGVVWVRVAEDTRDQIQTLGTRGELWHGDVVASASSTITIDVSTDIWGDSMAVVVHEVSGLRDIWPFENAGANNGQSSPISTSSNAGLNQSDDAYQFASACGADSSVGTIPGSPTNGFVAQDEVIGTATNTNVGHRCTTADKIVFGQSLAASSWAYSNFTRWVGLVGHWAADTSPVAPIGLVQEENAVGLGASFFVTMSSNVVSTNTLLLAVAIQGNNQVASVVQGGAVWVKDADLTHSANNVRVEVWRSSSFPDALNKIQITLTASSGYCVSLQEYSGILKTSPVDVSATNQGANDNVTSGITGAISADNELVFAAFAHAGSGSQAIQEVFGFRRVHAENFTSIVGASFVQNRTRESVSYQVTAKTYVSGNWCGAIVAYKNQLVVDAPGQALPIYSAERNQSGTTDSVNPSFDACEIPSSSFADGNRHLIIACGRGDGFNGALGFELRTGQAGSGDVFDQGLHRPFSPSGIEKNEMWGAMRVRAMAASDYLIIRAIFGGGNAPTLRQCNVVAVDLDAGNFFEGRDWWYDEDTALQANVNDVFADNVGSRLRFEADGTSTYLVMGHARLDGAIATGVDVEMAMQLWDETDSKELAKCGWPKLIITGERFICMNTMAVLKPAVGNHDIQIRAIGGTTWDLSESMVFVMRMDQLQSWGYDQNLFLNQASPGSVMEPSQFLPQASYLFRPDTLREMVTVAFAQADNSADDADGIASQAQFPLIDGGDRSVWDTENATLGNNVVDAETNCGSFAGGNTFTRIPTFGVSHREGLELSENTVNWHNRGIASNASIINRVSIASFGRYTQPVPGQTPAPTPLPAPAGVSPLTEKSDGTHEAEALDHMLEQFKP